MKTWWDQPGAQRRGSIAGWSRLSQDTLLRHVLVVENKGHRVASFSKSQKRQLVNNLEEISDRDKPGGRQPHLILRQSRTKYSDMTTRARCHGVKHAARNIGRV